MLVPELELELELEEDDIVGELVVVLLLPDELLVMIVVELELDEPPVVIKSPELHDEADLLFIGYSSLT